MILQKNHGSEETMSPIHNFHTEKTHQPSK